MKNNNVIKIALGVGLALQIPAAAETDFGDWRSVLQSKPKLYQNKENPYIQEIGIEGRAQWQTAHIDVNGITTDDSDTFTEWRRVRLGTKVKFLNYFSAKYQVNMVADGRPSGGDIKWGYDDIDEAYVTFDLGKAMNTEYFDDLSVGYGRYKYTLGYESTASSKKLLTVERSSLANKVYGSARPTGLKVEATKGDWEFAGAIYSTSENSSNNETFNGWQDGQIYWLHAGYKACDKLTLGADLAYNTADIDAGDDNTIGYEWGTSLNAHYEDGRFGAVGDLILGNNLDDSANPTREGNFYGVVLMPYYWLVENRLQGVFQYEYMASSEDNGVRTNSRYVRRNHDASGSINSGRGDQHHSLYTGLNYYLADHNAKIQAGVEYQQMDTAKGDFDALTYVLAFRSYF